MEYRRLGKSGLQISLFSFGSWLTFGGQVDLERSNRLMSIAYDNGVNYFDNAEVYGHGASEEMMGKVLKAKGWERSSYLISGKAFYGIHGSKYNKPNQHGLSRKHIVECCHATLKRFQTDYIDIFFCHRPDEQVSAEEIVRTMNTLMQQGKILYWATSEFTAAEIMEMHAVADRLGLEGPVMEEVKYNLFNRERVEIEYQPILRSYGLGIATYSPLESGILTGKYNEGIPAGSRLGQPSFGWLKERELNEDRLKKVRQLQSTADDLGMSMAHLALAWIIQNPQVSTTILGATKEEQLIANFKVLEHYPKLDKEVNEQIETILQNKPLLDRKL